MTCTFKNNLTITNAVMTCSENRFVTSSGRGMALRRRSSRIAAAERQKTAETGSNAPLAPSPDAPQSQWDQFIQSKKCQKACDADDIWTEGVSAQNSKIRALFKGWFEAYVDATKKQGSCNGLQGLLLNPNGKEAVKRAFGELLEEEARGNPKKDLQIRMERVEEAKEKQAKAKKRLIAALKKPTAKWKRVVNSEHYPAACDELRELAADLFTEQLCIERVCKKPKIRDLFTDWFDKRNDAMFYQSLYNDNERDILLYAATLCSPNELHKLKQDQNETRKLAQDTNESKEVAEAHLIRGLKQHLHKTK